MKKFKNAIIRWLGGTTDEELAYILGTTTGEVFQTVVDHLIEYAEEMDGTPAEQWADKMYKHLKSLQNIEGTYETENGNIKIHIKKVDNNEN